MKKIKSKKKKPSKIKVENPTGFEEIEFICPSCGKKVKMIKIKGLSTEGMLCQRCSQGEIQPSDFG